jgi:transposase-like protein
MSSIDQDLAAQALHLRNQFSPAQLAQLVRLIGPVPDTGLMSAEKFERVMDLMAGQQRRRGFSERSIRAARLVLVMGASVAEAAQEVGLARQVVHRLMGRIRERLQALPADWIKVDTWLPPAEAQQVIELAAQLLATYHRLEARE